MRRSGLVLALATMLLSCGSPEKYQKQGIEADTGAVDMAIGMDVGAEHRVWARQVVEGMGQSRNAYESGDTARAFAITDSLIASATTTFDTLPFDDVRSKFLLFMLTDLHSQAITWQELHGDTADVRIRTARFQQLADHVRALRDSVDRTH